MPQQLRSPAAGLQQRWIILLTALSQLRGALGSGPAILRIEPTQPGAGAAKSVPALFAEWTDKDDRVDGARLMHPSANPHGCKKHQKRCRGCAFLVWQGNCTFARKAKLAQQAGARLLIVAAAKDGPPVAMGAGAMDRSFFGARRPQITAVSISKASGRQVLLALEKAGGPLEAGCRASQKAYGDLLSELLVGVLAVGLVVLGAWHSVEDLRRPETGNQFNEEVFAVEESSGLQFVMFGSLMLTVLFFFMKYLIYVLLLLFASGAVSTTSMLLEPLIASWAPLLRARKACKLPQSVADCFGVSREHSCSDALAASCGGLLALSFLMFRNNDMFGWALQDAIAIMLLLTIQRTLRLPNLKVGTLLLICTFFFDIFWVFLSPMIFQKSVMIEVATGGGTGQSVPMVLKIPAMSSDLPGQFKILGLGDIAIPGLLISLLLRHDLSRKSLRCGGYFTAGVIGYALGLIATFVSLYLMKHGQPALLFLVPGTLLPTCIGAVRRGEFWALWNASYGPEAPPEGYESLPADVEAKKD